MNRAATFFQIPLPWLELFAHLMVFLVAILALVYPRLLGGTPVSTDTLIRWTLALVAGIAISRTLERYVTLKDIQGQTKKLSETSNVALLRSAQQCGVVGLYPRSDGDSLKAIVEAITDADGTLDICGVAFPSMTRMESLREAVVQHSQKDDVRVLLLKPDSVEAARRARIEAPLGRLTIADIEATTEWLLAQQAENKRFRLHYYDLPPMVMLILTDKFVFVEAYHFGRPEGLEGCIGGHVPFMKIRNRTELSPRKNPYEFFKAHYDYVWDFTRGYRVNLPISIIEARPSSYVVVENQTSKNISMDGWKLTGQESERPYQFRPDFVWQGQKRIKIFQDSEGQEEGPEVFAAEGDFMGNNTILRLTNRSGTLVAEWSLPSSFDGDQARPGPRAKKEAGEIVK